MINNLMKLVLIVIFLVALPLGSLQDDPSVDVKPSRVARSTDCSCDLDESEVELDGKNPSTAEGHSSDPESTCQNADCSDMLISSKQDETPTAEAPKKRFKLITIAVPEDFKIEDAEFINLPARKKAQVQKDTLRMSGLVASEKAEAKKQDENGPRTTDIDNPDLKKTLEGSGDDIEASEPSPSWWEDEVHEQDHKSEMKRYKRTLGKGFGKKGYKRGGYYKGKGK